MWGQDRTFPNFQYSSIETFHFRNSPNFFSLHHRHSSSPPTILIMDQSDDGALRGRRWFWQLKLDPRFTDFRYFGCLPDLSQPAHPSRSSVPGSTLAFTEN